MSNIKPLYYLKTRKYLGKIQNYFPGTKGIEANQKTQGETAQLVTHEELQTKRKVRSWVILGSILPSSSCTFFPLYVAHGQAWPP